jgi:hypothetical protein
VSIAIKERDERIAVIEPETASVPEREARAARETDAASTTPLVRVRELVKHFPSRVPMTWCAPLTV